MKSEIYSDFIAILGFFSLNSRSVDVLVNYYIDFNFLAEKGDTKGNFDWLKISIESYDAFLCNINGPNTVIPQFNENWTWKL